MSLYVETAIAAPIETVWRRTRDPAQHRRWDLRFSDITGLDGERDAAQRFTYTTRMAPGPAVTGTAVTTAERTRPDGTRVSALRFGSTDPLSPIAAGAGHWRYTPISGGVRFATAYRYRTRWGAAGRLLDTWALGPLMGWATAWSFDRLRLWCETGAAPERLRNRALYEAGLRALAIAAAALGAGAWAAAAAAALCLLLPPLPGTPAARRCRRTPSAHSPAPARVADPREAVR